LIEFLYQFEISEPLQEPTNTNFYQVRNNFKISSSPYWIRHFEFWFIDIRFTISDRDLYHRKPPNINFYSPIIKIDSIIKVCPLIWCFVPLCVFVPSKLPELSCR